MLDLNLIRENPEKVKEGLLKRGFVADLDTLLQKDRQRRDLIQTTESLKAKKNKISAQIPALKKEGADIKEIFRSLKEDDDLIKENDVLLSTLNKEIYDIMAELPNLTEDDVPAGGKENNVVLSVFGQKPEKDFEMRHHVDIAQELDIVDYARGAKLGGSGFWIYKGLGARMEWALLNYFMEDHIKDGYEMLLLPHILNKACGYTAGQFPKFQDDVFRIKNDEAEDGFTHFLLPTAETALVNLFRDEIVNEDMLPYKCFGYTPCYRREAGSYRADERGMIRGHQFNKVEIFQFTKPKDSPKAFEELVSKAASLVEGLGLHHRVSKLAAGDCSASMRKTYDIEVWIPSMDDYKEVSSASNAGDYQARRGNIRFRNKETGRPEFMHTLNASGLATSRIFPAILEQYQNADGSVTVPEALRKWMDGVDRIEKPR